MVMCDCDCIENVICNAKEVLCIPEQYRYTAGSQLFISPVNRYSQANIMVRMLKITYVK